MTDFYAPLVLEARYSTPANPSLIEVRKDAAGGVSIDVRHPAIEAGSIQKSHLGGSDYLYYAEDKTRELRDFLNEVLDEEEPSDFNLSALRLAQTHDTFVSFRYAKGDGRIIESRNFLPESVQKTKQGHHLVIGYDEDRDDVRAFRVDRIKGQVRF